MPKMPPTYKTFEHLDIGPITRDGSLQWSPDNKYISLATSDHIVIVRVNTDLLKVPIPSYFHSKTNIEINKSHGTAQADKVIPLKNFIKSLPMADILRLQCDVRVDSDLFTSNADLKKFRWSPCSFASKYSLIGSLNSLGFLEIIHCHSSGHSKLFQINNLWYREYIKKYVKMYKLPELPSDLRKILMNLCSLLWIESFIWIPMSDKTNSLLLVCYHRRGLLSIWNIKQRPNTTHDPSVTDSPVFVHQEMNPSSVKKKTNKEKSLPAPELPSIYEHDCNLVKVLTDYSDDPFSEQNFLVEEFIEKPEERVHNVEYINLNGKHKLCISRSNGTLELIELNLSDDHLDNNLPPCSTVEENFTFENSTLSSTVDEQSLVGTSMSSDGANKDGKTKQQYRKSDQVETDIRKDKPDMSSKEEVNIGGKQDIFGSSENEKYPTKSERKRKISLVNEDYGSKKAKTSANDDKDVTTDANFEGESNIKSENIEKSNSKNTEGNKISETDTVNITAQAEETKTFIPSRLNVYERTDRMPIANLIISNSNDHVILIFNKLALLHCIVLNKDGTIVEKFHEQMKTRTITAISKYGANTFLVGTYENKVLLVLIDTLKSRRDNSSPKSSDRISVYKSFDMNNETHLLNGIANSQNSYLTVLSLKINVRFESYYTSSRNPCVLLLTSLQSPSSLLSKRFPTAPLYKQIDLIKCISYNNMNIVKHSLLDKVQDVRTKYFFLKLFKPSKIIPKVKQQIDETAATLEKAIYLSYIKKCVKEGIFREHKNVLILFREWIAHNFLPDSYAKLRARLPNDPYKESCFFCSSGTKVESMRYALCGAGHRIARCSLSLVQCLGSYVRCSFCLAYASTLFSENPRLACVFCNAKFTL